MTKDQLQAQEENLKRALLQENNNILCTLIKKLVLQKFKKTNQKPRALFQKALENKVRAIQMFSQIFRQIKKLTHTKLQTN